MKKVLVMGYTSLENYGDNFIVDCVKYLVSCNDNIQVEEGDLEPKLNTVSFILYAFFIFLSRVIKKQSFSGKCVFLAVKSRCYRIYKQKIINADAVIFGCGSFKYGTQKLWAYYSLAVEIAKKYNKPILFNAMNIQKYDADNWKCDFLKKHANYPNVKVITSRDGSSGVQKLRNEYEIKQQIICEGVGDAAFWIPECYGVSKANRNEIVIGVNLIDGNIFKRYGGNIKEAELIKIYLKLLQGLDAKGYKWQLFTNGLEVDLKFGDKILDTYGERREIRHPKSTKDLLDIIASYSYVFGARLHADICAYALGIPVFGFYWDEKLVHFAEMANLEGYFFTQEQLLSGEFLDKCLADINGNYLINEKLRTEWKLKTQYYINQFVEDI